jgi:hypothetical protein
MTSVAVGNGENRSGHAPERQKARVKRAMDRSQVGGSEAVAADQPDIPQKAIKQLPGV